MIKLINVKISRQDNNIRFIEKRLAKLLGCKIDDIIEIIIKRKSVDARKRFNIFWIYTFEVAVKNEAKLLKKNTNLVKVESKEELKFNSYKGKYSPIIIGSGPSGLFAALMLAKYGAKPIIVEQGDSVDNRIKKLKNFFETEVLCANTNVQFGEGGAGTFSDGKLNTSVKDKRSRIVLEELVRAGADSEILYINKPHIGTDRLVEILKNIRKKIEELGGRFLFNTSFERVEVNGEVKRAYLKCKDMCNIYDTDNLILALGNASRKTFENLYRDGIRLEKKPFAVGLRVQHSQSIINKAMYGEEAPDDLPVADYKLTYHTRDAKAVYSFCMCPGGYVVNSSSEEGGLVINGMSYSKRNSPNANSAIVVGVNFTSEDVFEGMKFQEEIEKRAFKKGNGKIPTSTYGAYKNNSDSIALGNVVPCFKGDYTLVNIRNILPPELDYAIIEAMEAFGEKISGFNSDDCLISAVESRTSSPIRIPRDKDMQSNMRGIYPIGEGAGYAGGIMSAAIDGIKVAEIVLRG